MSMISVSPIILVEENLLDSVVNTATPPVAYVVVFVPFVVFIPSAAIRQWEKWK